MSMLNNLYNYNLIQLQSLTDVTLQTLIIRRTVSAVIPVHPVGMEAPVDINMNDVVIYKDIQGVTHDIALLRLPLPVSVGPVDLPDCGKPPPQM